jgi:hypothetical protein
LFDPNIVLLIQYKTVQLYTPLEHKNFTMAACTCVVGYPEAMLAQ